MIDFREFMYNALNLPLIKTCLGEETCSVRHRRENLFKGIFILSRM